LIKRKTYFFSDLHADKQALLNSLKYCDDPSALYLIGGDYLDKGPSNLELLSEIKKLSNQVEVKLLAGNHDLRMLMVLQNWENQDNFLFQNIYSTKRFEKRIVPFLEECGGIEKAKDLFLNPDGEFGWFYPSLSLLYLDNNFLFVHAGLSDIFVKQLRDKGEDLFNTEFRKVLQDKEVLFDFYHSRTAGAFRTKYRQGDPVFTNEGAAILREQNINFVVTGHDSQTKGHRLRFVHGIPHLTCDVTVDSGSRWKENLGTKSGWGVAILDPKNHQIKCFSSEATLGFDWRLYK
jgi:hypothetical protein